ncbi:MAG: hypothetical protein A3H42_04430 [Deltaproteobacteria bacterium RIFCSPLOWO2_02_FULL_46_8]|nr:MAG: hypothetical protein A3H42_04430 [Deltaproteobacteria bacterium RIFCSPLOWO2_02_FULL_46_8]
MKQIIQNYRTGQLSVEKIPTPQLTPSSILVRTLYSAISAGTEKTKIDTAKMSLWQKAKSRPDLVRKVIDKAKKDGIFSTLKMVQNKLNEPVPMGYSLVGKVEEVGEWVEGIQVGDTVACAGAGFANHAEYNVVPHRLAVRVPSNTPLDEAAFTTIGSIALQGIRQMAPQMGERVVVIGLGLLGQITSLLLKANGCFVFGIEKDPWKLEQSQKQGIVSDAALAGDFGLAERIGNWTRDRGADAVILTASTPSNEPIEQAGIFCREKGRVVIVGAVGTQFSREHYYHKEIEIRMARSYGPGRYDPFYETLGLDYPSGYVRFTEQRNMEAFLDLLASKHINLAPLITHRFPFSEATQAFELLKDEKSRYLGILLDYNSPTNTPECATSSISIPTPTEKFSPLTTGFIGLGNYATAQILPCLQKIKGIRFKKVTTASGLKAQMKGQAFGFEETAQNPEEILTDPEIGTVFILTRHDSHAALVTQALSAGKNVFVEKPLCLNREELQQIQQAYDTNPGLLMVGFNRRFSPMVQKIRKEFSHGAEHILCRVNAGALPADHWLNIPEIGGGRLLGEACHFIDLIAYLGASPIQSVFAKSQGEATTSSANTQNCHLTLTLKNGALATILYFSSGNSRLPKEYLEIHGEGKSIILDDFVSIQIAGKTKNKERQQDKGQNNMLQTFLQACNEGNRHASPISAEMIWNTTSATLAALESLNKGQPIFIDV